MKNLFILMFYATRAILKILKPGGINALISENLALRQQLIVLNRQRKRSPNLTCLERLSFSFFAALLWPKIILKTAIIIKPAMLLKFHQALIRHKYQLLYSNKTQKKSGPKGPSQELINLILEMKQRNPNFGYLRIAMQISDQFGMDINKDIVRRILAKDYRSPSGGGGPSWLTFIGHTKDSLWSLDLFRCESILLKTHWVMVVMDQFSRKIINFSVHPGDLDGITVCRMFNSIIGGKKLPLYLSTDNDPLFRFHRWQANLRVLDVQEIKSVPYTPISHPFIERVIGTCRRELIDKILFWNSIDLQKKLEDFRNYYNESRCHSSINGSTPGNQANKCPAKVININRYHWERHCRGLFYLPKAA